MKLKKATVWYPTIDVLLVSPAFFYSRLFIITILSVKPMREFVFDNTLQRSPKVTFLFRACLCILVKYEVPCTDVYLTGTFSCVGFPIIKG